MNNLRGDKNFYPTSNGVKIFILQNTNFSLKNLISVRLSVDYYM